jgi:type III restriction enzyme
MATGTGKTWVLQALMIWQLLNKTAALAEGMDDARFTRQFMVVAPGLIVYERLLDAFCGKLVAASGARGFRHVGHGAVCRPVHSRGAPRGGVCLCARQCVRQAEIGLKATGNGMIAITNWHLLAEGDVRTTWKKWKRPARRWSRSRWWPPCCP